MSRLLTRRLASCSKTKKTNRPTPSRPYPAPFYGASPHGQARIKLCLFCFQLITWTQWIDAAKCRRVLYIPDSDVLQKNVATALGGLYDHKTQFWMPLSVCDACQRHWDRVDVPSAKRRLNPGAGFINRCRTCDGDGDACGLCHLVNKRAKGCLTKKRPKQKKRKRDPSKGVPPPTRSKPERDGRLGKRPKPVQDPKETVGDVIARQRRTPRLSGRGAAISAALQQQRFEQGLTPVGSCSARKFRRLHTRQECFSSQRVAFDCHFD